MLATHPLYQRKGFGKRLLGYGLDIADRNDAKTYLEASQVGLSLYLGMGWQEISEFEVDLRSYGGERVEVIKCLIRMPREENADNKA